MQTVLDPPAPPIDPPEKKRGGGNGECWRCHGTGWSREIWCEAEARHQFQKMGIGLPEGVFKFASASGPCGDCDEGRRIAKMLKTTGDE